MDSKVSVSRDMLKELVEKLRGGDTNENGGVDLRVALWNRTSKNGKEYKYARLDIPQKKEEPKPVENVNDNPVFDDDDLPF